jgi:maleate isomerase
MNAGQKTQLQNIIDAFNYLSSREGLMRHAAFRIGQIVPSSNITMETEIPAMLTARQSIRPERFTFHSSRMRMRRVSAEELAQMDAESDRCAAELADARVDVMGYACLVAIMAMGPGYHRQSQQRLSARVREEGASAAVVSSAGALVDGLKLMGAQRIALVAPYMTPLTRVVVDYIEAEGIAVVDWRALEIPDNLDVARHAPERLPDIIAGMDLSQADVLVASACVQMPSLPVVPLLEAQFGKPVVTAAIATVHAMLSALELEPVAPGAGALLSGAYPIAAGAAA